MAQVNLPKDDSKFATGKPAYGTDITANVNALAADYNGNITDYNISGSAAIKDSKLDQITTAGKVSGTAITGLASLPAGAGVIPAANLPSGVVSDIILRGFELVYANTTTVTVNSGVLVNGITLVTKTANTTLTIGTAGDWYDGATHSYGGGAGWNYIGVDNAGNIKFLFTNAPSKADISGNTAGTLLYYPNGATYYRVIGRVRVHTDNTILLPWIQSGNILYYSPMVSFACGTSATFASVSTATVISPIEISAQIGLTNGSSQSQAIRIAGTSDVGINCSTNAGDYNNAVVTGGYIPIVGNAIEYKTSGGTAVGYVISTILNIR